MSGADKSSTPPSVVAQFEHLRDEWTSIQNAFDKIRADHEYESEMADYNLDSDIYEWQQGIGGVTFNDLSHMSHQIGDIRDKHAVTGRLASKYLPTLFAFRLLTLMEMALRDYHNTALQRRPAISLSRVIDDLTAAGKFTPQGQRTLHHLRELRNSLAHDATNWSPTHGDVKRLLETLYALFRHIGYTLAR